MAFGNDEKDGADEPETRLYYKDLDAGSHANTMSVPGPQRQIPVDWAINDD